jgi:hypothetical protein
MTSTPVDVARRKRLTLIAALVVVVIGAMTPVIVRLTTPNVPTLHRTARELLPPPAAAADDIILYAEPGELTAMVADLLPRLAVAVEEVFPQPLGRDAGAPPVVQAPIEIALFADRDRFTQTWVQVFASDRGLPGRRGVGRATFVLYDGSEATEQGDEALAEHAAALAHWFGRSVFEQHLGERLRLVPEWAQHLVGEMFAVAVIPDLEDRAAQRYTQERETQPASTDREWMNRFDGQNRAMHRALSTLIAAELLRGDRTTDFVRLIRDGESVETAFRAASAGRRATDDPNRRAPVAAGTSLEAMIDEIDRREVPGDG